MPAPKIQRGCGFRIAGGIYATATGNIYEMNIPIDDFLQCPAVPVDPTSIGLAAQGVLIKEGTPYGRQGYWDVFDWIGAGDYPFVPDFVEEGKRYGFSRRIPKSAPIHLLNTDSLHLLGHPRAILSNYKEFYKTRQQIMDCPRGHEIHDAGTAEQSCLGLLWEALPADNTINGDPTFRGIVRHFPTNAPVQFNYNAARWPVEPEWEFGLFAALPITAFEVVEDTMEDKHQAAMELLEKSGTDIPYYLVQS